MQDNTGTSFRKWENAHIVLWLIKDTSWLLSYKPLAIGMGGPTLALAMFITWRMRTQRAEFFHNLAVCGWIAGNIVWMLGEFYAQDRWRPYAQWFFFFGTLVLLYYYGSIVLLRAKSKAD
jgi:hypothetical protein